MTLRNFAELDRPDRTVDTDTAVGSAWADRPNSRESTRRRFWHREANPAVVAARSIDSSSMAVSIGLERLHNRTLLVGSRARARRNRFVDMGHRKVVVLVRSLVGIVDIRQALERLAPRRIHLAVAAIDCLMNKMILNYYLSSSNSIIIIYTQNFTLFFHNFFLI